ncbi:NitT/TauT family transport system permease protein [Paraburkholderia sp. MM5482-R2]
MWKTLRPSRANLVIWQWLLLVLCFVLWYVLTSPTLIPPFYFDDPNKAAFFFGEPQKVLQRIWEWFTGGEIYLHLWITLVETVLAFVFGTTIGLGVGLWLALAPTASALFDPYVKAANSMPRVILAPIFGVWFGLGIWSKVALGVTLVFFIVFFNVYQGVKEVSPVVLANARMLGANRKQLLRFVYLPSAMSWVFSSLHTSVGLAFVGSVVGEYLGLGARRRLSDPAGRGHLRYQHGVRGDSGVDRVRADSRCDRRDRGAAFDEVAAAHRGYREAVNVDRKRSGGRNRSRPPRRF